MANIGVTVTGDKQVAIRFDQFPVKLHDKLLAIIRSLTTGLAAKIKAAEPQRSGKLRSETTSAVYDDAGRKISGRVFVSGDYKKAGALEYGAHGRAKISGHSARLDHVFGNHLNAPLTVAVAGFTRQMNIASRKFLRGPLAASASSIDEALQTVVNEAIEEGHQ
jgi:hypothetical protein